MSVSFAQLLLVLLIVLILFGAGKLPRVMGEIGKGLKNFKDNFKGSHDQKNEEESKN